MDNISENKVRKLSTGIKTISIIEIVLQSIVAIAVLLMYRSEMDEGFIKILAIFEISAILSIIGASMILARKKVGVFLFFITFIIYFIFTIIIGLFSVSTISGLILTGVLFKFIWDDRDLFGL